MEPKYKVGQIVLYQNGERFELGVVKEVLPKKKRYAQKQDGLHGEPTGESYIGWMYRVNYHTGDTTALTDEDLLHPIQNDYAFLILRRSADEGKV